MNIAGGGSLRLDVSSADDDAQYPAGWLSNLLYRKPVLVQAGTLLHRILGRTVVRVNSLHRPAIRDLAPGFVVSAREPNRIAQTTEKPDHPFFLGVQFHPELLLHQRRFRNLFRAFLAAARSRDATPFPPSGPGRAGNDPGPIGG